MFTIHPSLMLIVSYKASSSVMRPCPDQLSLLCHQAGAAAGLGDTAFEMDRFPKRSVLLLTLFLDANSTEVLQTREEMFHHWFSLSLSCVALSSGHSPGFSCCAGVHQPWRTQQTGRQTEGISTVPATGKRSTWGIFPAPKDTAELPVSVLVKFH